MLNLHIEGGEYLPLREVVFQTLRNAIIRGELKPGERLLEIQLSEMLGVSRTPIREAIRKLELEGLVVMEPRKGATVASITAQDLTDVLEVRRVLESLAAELASKKRTEEDVSQLAELHEQMQNEENIKDLHKLANLDETFHDILYRATGNQRLFQMINQLREQLYWYRLAYVKSEEARKNVFAEHLEILEALKNQDVKAAKKAMKLHIVNQEKAILKLISEKAE
ncbi:MAG: GntR family transcriptional regulator [Lachnospiraceae bacterium]|nr:GntR family transcriptional regulator [Lachnospiraceae bacterium]